MKERAIDEMERAYRERAGEDVCRIKVDPMLDDPYSIADTSMEIPTKVNPQSRLPVLSLIRPMA